MTPTYPDPPHLVAFWNRLEELDVDCEMLPWRDGWRVIYDKQAVLVVVDNPHKCEDCGKPHGLWIVVAKPCAILNEVLADMPKHPE